MSTQTFETQGVRVAVEGCGHGTLNAIYAAVAKSCEARGWDGVDVLIIGGDFQAVRNAADLTVMSVPAKYREMGDFWEYYAGARTAPYLTLFAAATTKRRRTFGSSTTGLAAPNIYYLGAANGHHERLPFGVDDVKSFYHVREVDVRKLLLVREQVDVGISHDWPRAIEKWGDEKALWRMKPDFEAESRDGTLGNVAAEYVLDRLRPPYWFSAHLHCKFSALKRFDLGDAGAETKDGGIKSETQAQRTASVAAAPTIVAEANPEEIDLNDDDDVAVPTAAASTTANPNEISLDDDDDDDDDEPAPAAPTIKPEDKPKPVSHVSADLRAQLPASFAAPKPQPKTTPGQPVPATITNKQVRFLALDKCLPRRHFLQLLDIHPHDGSLVAPPSTPPQHPGRFPLQYDPEWLAITRALHGELTIGDRAAHAARDRGEAHYAPLIDEARAWVGEHVAALDVPANFVLTAPPHDGSPNWRNVPDQPFEYTNPQTAAFCEMLQVENLWHASEDERMARKAEGPPPPSERFGGGFRGGRGGHGGRDGGRGGRGGRGRGRGRGRFH
ncbi:lariat debranching enzyme [Verticillium alfalfae VaMs.102]|uniref:Lariat debranching enzyme n=1 Tax=Verticillium alfalfae (strain VaMs.102 / ATCC MYA-4576 / FGSC 10136) TaxID=526221 RepID=C9SAI9_VERA1|nr:lariat debranching enzyme [Verticillium alfalfae VaMs.102]EEY15437.1 lariat debranching enzyme [Verticillium alfalfae VaMs.102]